MTNRASYIAGLRELADLLEAHPELDTPISGGTEMLPISVYVTTGDEAEQKLGLAQFARAMPGRVDKEVSDLLMKLRVTLGGPGGLIVQAVAYREAVCERVVVGTHTEKRWVKDPVQFEEIPEIEVEEEVEDVEWICGPVLGEALNEKALTA